MLSAKDAIGLSLPRKSFAMSFAPAEPSAIFFTKGSASGLTVKAILKIGTGAFSPATPASRAADFNGVFSANALSISTTPRISFDSSDARINGIKMSMCSFENSHFNKFCVSSSFRTA